MRDNQTDLELIDEVLSGTAAAFSELVSRHQRYVFSLALRFTKSREDAEEIAQDCFVKAYRSLAAFQRTSKFTTWLYGIVYHTSMTFLRKKKLEVSSIDDETTYLQVEDTASDMKANLVEEKSRSEYLEKAIDMLLPDDAVIITLFYKGEQSLEEIATATGYEANTVKVKLHRARQRLRGKLELILKHEVKDLVR
ncbi:MAG: RNA polymerase sigma factor [Chitinophagaceae bacterium]|nr:RNA polymerase sigma factor [Chitinophagaceae bacterium]